MRIPQLARFTFSVWAMQLLLATAVLADPLRIITADAGGNPFSYAGRIERHDGPVEISGRCSSACTMWLGHPEVCVTPGAILRFHEPRSRWHFLTGTTQLLTEPLMRRFYRRAHPDLLAWYDREVTSSRHWDVLTGRQLIAWGWAPACAA